MWPLLSVLFALLAACGWDAAPLPAPAGNALRIATYNVHYIRLDEESGPWSRGDWDRRKTPLAAAAAATGADVMAFQEMESFSRASDGAVNLARDWLLEALPGYGAAATGDWRRFPSTQPIFYRRDRLEPLDQGWFFFSETPDAIYSRTFDGSYPAFASWAQFRDLRTQARFRVVNVHFDAFSPLNRRRSAALVAERLAPWISAGETVILAGDLNAIDGMVPHDILERAGLAFAGVSGSTFHFGRGLNLFGAIDHIAYSGAERVAPPMVLRRRFGGEWPTDHYPVVVDLRL
jgi:endonuclease/exonuclease/phosphatase family metal-dependent hydrolase